MGPPSCWCAAVQEPGVVRLGEALALVLAVPVAGVHAVDQPGTAAGLDRDQRGQRHPLVAGAGDPLSAMEVSGGRSAAP
jgi:hypothetical protein